MKTLKKPAAEKLSPMVIRPKLMLIAIPAAAAATLLVCFAGTFAYHQAALWLNHGQSCVVVGPDGQGKFSYGRCPE
jgi:hypothetical protein